MHHEQGRSQFPIVWFAMCHPYLTFGQAHGHLPRLNLVSILVISVLLWSSVPGFADSTVVFNEIMYHPNSRESQLEWLELHSQMGVDIDISGWSITGGIEYTFPVGTVVPGGGFVVVAISPTDLAAESGYTEAIGPFTGRLSNDSDRLELRNNSNRLMDRVSYRDDGPWPVGADGAGVTLAKGDPDTSSPPSKNWQVSREMGGTPGRHNFSALELQPTTLLPVDATWHYEISGIDLGADWRTIAYDDGSWATAQAPFFHEAGSVVTSWMGDGNREGPHSFGFSPSTNNAGGDYPGEIGGYIERSPAAWFADNNIGAINLATDDLSVSLKWTQNGAGNLSFGYFQAASYGASEQPAGLYWQIDDTNLYLVAGSGVTRTERLVGSLTVDEREAITMHWRAETQTWSIALASGASQSVVVPDISDLPLDHFGVLALGASDGSGFTFWADDIEYTVVSPSLTQRSQPTGALNRPAAAQTELAAEPTTSYFRTSFDFSGAPRALELWLQPIAQDGAIVYLNGRELHRFNMPSGPIGYETFALGNVDAFTLGPPIRVSRDDLVIGSNVLAVEVHGANAADIGMAFGATLEWRTSPTAVNGPFSVIISEVGAVLDSQFGIELMNKGGTAVDLVGHVLVRSGASGEEYVFPNQMLQPGTHLWVSAIELGFDVTENDKLFLLNPARNALIDAAVALTRPRARPPMSSSEWLVPFVATPGAPNVFELSSAVVINEVMYHQRPDHEPSQGTESTSGYTESREAWIELYNGSTRSVDLTDWQLTDAVEFAFGSGTVLGPGEYLLVARDRASLQASYPGVRIAGEFSRTLSNRTDRIALTDNNGNLADEVRYFDRGHWPSAADGHGSSLELRDPRADNLRPEAWASSSESQKATWGSYTYRGTAASIVPGDPGDPPLFQIGFLDGAGEVLLDDLSVVMDPEGSAIELIPNGTFDNGTMEGWRFQGNHRHTAVIIDPANADNYVLRLTGTGPTEVIFNHGVATLIAPAVDGEEYAISFRARWVSGSNQITTRLYYNRLPRTTFVEVPTDSGTPGTRNSHFVANIGPTFEGLRHSPVTPQPGQPVAVSVRADDPDGVRSVNLWWSANEGAWKSAPMAAEPDSSFTASIPGQDSATIVQFFVEARDSFDAGGFSPPAGRDSRALYVVRDGQALSGAIPNFRTILLPSEAAYLHNGDNVQSNERLGGTAVWKETQPYYDVGVRLRGSLSPSRGNSTVGHSIAFQPDHLFRGVHSTVAIERDARGALSVREILLLHVVTHAGDMPGMYNDIVNAIAPVPEHTSRAMMRLGAQSDVFLESQYEDGSAGTIFETDFLRRDTDDVYIEFMDLGDDKEFYRWNFIVQNNRTKDDYSGLIRLAKTLGMPAGAELEVRAAEVMDVDEWMRVFAMQALGGVGDTYLQDGNHNFRVYQRPSDGRMLAFPWDMDSAFSYANFPWGEGNLTKVIERTPYTRMYYDHLRDLVETTFNPTYMAFWVQHYGTLGNEDFDDILDFIGSRVAVTESALPDRVPFVITSNGGRDFSVTGATTELEGSGWIDVREIRVDGLEDPLELIWTSLQDWRAEVALLPGQNSLVFRAYDRRGREVGNTAIAVSATPRE